MIWIATFFAFLGSPVVRLRTTDAAMHPIVLRLRCRVAAASYDGENLPKRVLPTPRLRPAPLGDPSMNALVCSLALLSVHDEKYLAWVAEPVAATAASRLVGPASLAGRAS